MRNLGIEQPATRTRSSEELESGCWDLVREPLIRQILGRDLESWEYCPALTAAYGPDGLLRVVISRVGGLPQLSVIALVLGDLCTVELRWDGRDAFRGEAQVELQFDLASEVNSWRLDL